jgi:thiol-disulfide isomerase/thioredoxin
MKTIRRVLAVVALGGVLGTSGCDQKTPPAPGRVAVDQVQQESPQDVSGTEAVKAGISADSQPGLTAPNEDSYATLKGEYEEAFDKYRSELQAEAEAKQKAALAELAAAEKAIDDAKTDQEKQSAEQRVRLASRFPSMKMLAPSDGPGETFSPRFLAFAVKHPSEPAALDALYLTLVTSGGPTGKVGTWSGAVKALQQNHVESPELKKAVRLFRMLSSAHDDEADKLLRDVIARNPDRRAQGRACQALAQGRAAAAEKGERLKADERFRTNAALFMGGKEGVEKLIAGVSAAEIEAEELSRTLREKYNDVCPDLSIGNPAPEVVSKDLEDKSVTLSSLQGKVVVLDIWATWCGPCKAMIPHEREMVERLKDKPFVLVSISVDQEKETLQNFLDKEPMPWSHWWNGSEGGIIEDWNVEAYPTIIVLDAKGVIRYKNLRGEELEEAVNQLLDELETN